MSLDATYKDYFIRNLHDALSGHRSNSVSEAVRYSEHSATKCIGITIETRPDYCLKPHLDEMLLYGCTRIEMGIQSVYESVARETNRGHTVASACHSFHLAKDCGFKVVTHMMPDLPNTGLERDLEGFREFFENPVFRPDGLKLYPTLVIRGTGLYELWKTGRYKNYTPGQLVELTATVLAMVPPWTRVYRVQRDIPMPLVSSGVEHGNLRELALARMRDLDLPCRDVRAREVGMKQIHEGIDPDNVELVRRDYVANGGWETFLSYEDPLGDILIGLLRLRKVSTVAHRPEMTAGGGGGGGRPGLLNRQGASCLRYSRGSIGKGSVQVPASRIWTYAHGGGGTNLEGGAWFVQGPRHLWGRHSTLLQEDGVRAGRALHEQGIVMLMRARGVRRQNLCTVVVT